MELGLAAGQGQPQIEYHGLCGFCHSRKWPAIYGNMQQPVARYKRLFSQASGKDLVTCRDIIQILSFVRQLHDYQITTKVAKKNLDTLGAAFRFAFKLTSEKMFEKRLFTPSENIFTIETSNSNEGIGPCFSFNSTKHFYTN